MVPRPPVQAQLLINLTIANSRQELLDELLLQLPKLKSVTLWWQADGVQTAICHAGDEDAPDEGDVVTLPSERRYLLSFTAGIQLGPEVLAVLGLRLVHLDARHVIASLHDLRSSLEVAAQTDPLTGLLNRRAFDNDLDAVDAAGGSFAVVFIDLDGFKQLNDRYGHAVGDSMLRGYGTWLTRMIGSWGRAYRLGGDEYLILVTGFPGSPEEFGAWANERLQVPFVDGVSASIGIAWRHESWRVSDVVRVADQRMYQAKTARPDHVKAGPPNKAEPEDSPQDEAESFDGLGTA